MSDHPPSPQDLTRTALLMDVMQEVRDLLRARGLGTQDAMIVHMGSLGSVCADAAKPGVSSKTAWRNLECLRGLFRECYESQRREAKS